MRTFRKCVIAVAAATILATAPVEAHMPAECTYRFQELEWALEGQGDTREHVLTSHNVVVNQIELFGEAEYRFPPGLIEQYVRMDKHVRHKVRMLLGCVLEPPTLE